LNRWSVVLLYTLSGSCMASGNGWPDYLQQIASADPATIQALPAKVLRIGHNLDDEHAAQLATAIGIALIKDPVNVLKATDVIETYTDELQQRFGTSLICSIPGQNEYPQEEIEGYFSRAELALVDAGIPGKDCLNTMRDTFAEIRQGVNGHK